jgi:hypothetical protein
MLFFYFKELQAFLVTAPDFTLSRSIHNFISGLAVTISYKHIWTKQTHYTYQSGIKNFIACAILQKPPGKSTFIPHILEYNTLLKQSLLDRFIVNTYFLLTFCYKNVSSFVQATIHYKTYLSRQPSAEKQRLQFWINHPFYLIIQTVYFHFLCFITARKP